VPPTPSVNNSDDENSEETLPKAHWLALSRVVKISDAKMKIKICRVDRGWRVGQNRTRERESGGRTGGRRHYCTVTVHLAVALSPLGPVAVSMNKRSGL